MQTQGQDHHYRKPISLSSGNISFGSFQSIKTALLFLIIIQYKYILHKEEI